MQNTLQKCIWTPTNVTIVTLNWRSTVYWRGIQAILMVKGAKGKTKDSFGSQMAHKKHRSACQCRRLTLACWVLRRYELNPNQHKTSENNKCIVSHSSCTIVMIRTLNGGTFDASMRSSKHACIPGDRRSSTMYWRSQFIRQRAISNHYRRSRSMLNPLQHTDPWFRSNLLVIVEGRLAWTTENGKLNEAGHLGTH